MIVLHKNVGVLPRAVGYRDVTQPSSPAHLSVTVDLLIKHSVTVDLLMNRLIYLGNICLYYVYVSMYFLGGRSSL